MRKNKNIVKVNEYLQMGQYAQEYHCSSCGTKGKFILNETDCCKYICRNCGYQGDFEQEISDQNDVVSGCHHIQKQRKKKCMMEIARNGIESL